MNITIQPINKEEFEVTVEAPQRTVHRVTVPEQYYHALTGGSVSVESLLRVSFEFLLERESNTSILRSFSLPIINRYFPEYESHMRRLLLGA